MWDSLKTAISDVIKTNDNGEITGQILQDSLFAIIVRMGGCCQWRQFPTKVD